MDIKTFHRVVQGIRSLQAEVDEILEQPRPRFWTAAQFERSAKARLGYAGGQFVLDRETCDWVIDEPADTAICRTHGEVCDGVGSKHFPGAHLTPKAADD